ESRYLRDVNPSLRLSRTRSTRPWMSRAAAPCPESRRMAGRLQRGERAGHRPYRLGGLTRAERPETAPGVGGKALQLADHGAAQFADVERGVEVDLRGIAAHGGLHQLHDPVVQHDRHEDSLQRLLILWRELGVDLGCVAAIRGKPDHRIEAPDVELPALRAIGAQCEELLWVFRHLHNGVAAAAPAGRS